MRRYLYCAGVMLLAAWPAAAQVPDARQSYAAGRFDLEKGDYDKAIAEFNAALDINPDFADAWRAAALPMAASAMSSMPWPISTRRCNAIPTITKR